MEHRTSKSAINVCTAHNTGNLSHFDSFPCCVCFSSVCLHRPKVQPWCEDFLWKRHPVKNRLWKPEGLSVELQPPKKMCFGCFFEVKPLPVTVSYSVPQQSWTARTGLFSRFCFLTEPSSKNVGETTNWQKFAHTQPRENEFFTLRVKTQWRKKTVG